MNVFPRVLKFSGKAGMPDAIPQVVHLTGLQDGIGYTLEHQPAWISTSQVGQGFQVSVNLTGLKVGEYTGKVTVKSPGSPDMLVGVTLVVT
jgi:hypothetical protein